MYFFDPFYMLFIALPLLVVTFIIQMWVKAAYSRYAKMPNSSGVTGAQAAQGILRDAGITDVRIEVSRGWLSDHYDPRNRVLRLSPENYEGRSIAAVGIAAHEAGHAIQHAAAYAPLALRNAAVPMAGIGSNLGYVLIFIGVLMGFKVLGAVGLLLFSAVVVFQLVNLPVEFNASRRALAYLPAMGILTPEENAGARSMLTAAAATYVAATVGALLHLLYYAWRLGLLGGGSRD